MKLKLRYVSPLLTEFKEDNIQPLKFSHHYGQGEFRHQRFFVRDGSDIVHTTARSDIVHTTPHSDIVHTTYSNIVHTHKTTYSDIVHTTPRAPSSIHLPSA